MLSLRSGLSLLAGGLALPEADADALPPAVSLSLNVIAGAGAKYSFNGVPSATTPLNLSIIF
jgi:hypothetical protein